MAVRKQQTLLIALVALTLGACGSDSSGNGDTGKKDAGGSQQGDGDGHGGGDGGTDGGKIQIGKDGGQTGTHLGDNTAGNACTKAEDCPGGMCGTELPSGLMGTTPAPGGYCTGSCSTDDECGKGGACAGAINVMGQSRMGSCEKVCTKNADCRDGYYCAQGLDASGLGGPKQPDTCQPKPTTGKLDDGIAGAACAAATDCKGTGGECTDKVGEVIPGTGTTAPGGYCTATCIEDGDCGAGGICVVGLTGGSGKCYQGCTKDECTRDGYGCVDVGTKGQKACSPVKMPLPDNTVGMACAGDETCGGGSCASQLPTSLQGQQVVQTPAPGGYCTARCTKKEDCGGGAECVGAVVFGSTVINEGVCLQTCADKTACRSGYDCKAFQGLGQAPNTCLPDGTTPADAGTPPPATDAGH